MQLNYKKNKQIFNVDGLLPGSVLLILSHWPIVISSLDFPSHFSVYPAVLQRMFPSDLQNRTQAREGGELEGAVKERDVTRILVNA